MHLPCGTYNISYAQDMAIVRTRLQWGILIAFLILLSLLPLFLGGGMLMLLIHICIWIIACLGLNILIGYCGQISAAQAAFMAVGAYTSAILVAKVGLPFWVALPCSGLMAGLIGLLFGIPSLRVRWLYLVLSTLAAQFIIIWVISHWTGFTGGPLGMAVPLPEIGGLVFDSDTKYYYLVMIIAVLLTFFAKNIVRTKTGRAFVAVRDNDIAAEVMGINVFPTKLLAFFIGCFYAGIAGCLWVHFVELATPDHYTLFDSVWYLGAIVIGGLGSITGTIFGVLFIKLLWELCYLASPFIGEVLPTIAETIAPALPELATGLTIILFLLFEPRGLYHRWEIFKTSYRNWPFAY